MSGAETHPLYAVQTVQNSPHREQRKEFSLTNDVSVWLERMSVMVVVGGGLHGSGKIRVCVGEVT